MADLIERASAINALQYVLDSPNYSKALGEILRIPTADTPQTEEIEWLEALERKVRADKADRKTENSSEIPNNCEWCKFFDGENCYSQEPCKAKDEPQTDCNKLINEVVKLDMSREDKFKVMELLARHCEKCKHYLFTDIDGYYCEHETYGQPCGYEPKDEPQTCDHKCIQTEIGCGHEDCQWK